ncbi:hypothetical protein CTheo_1757 [Ceratobasidium theobromae]|uniref:Transmembrane protein n=1 Tax=Ceratobasidium theobromae TaxID=1582974 RepID=A0A5N5QT03_9AGAM|nr:hypothetical protein CTheo_1757 [Ceratobasidium theobromae]
MLEIAYACYFFATILSSLLTVAVIRVLPQVPPHFIPITLSLVLALPLIFYLLTLIPVRHQLLLVSPRANDQRDVSCDSADTPRIIPITILTCFSSIQRYFALIIFTRVHLGHPYAWAIEHMYALAMVELAVVLALGIGFWKVWPVSNLDEEKGGMEPQVGCPGRDMEKQ